MKKIYSLFETMEQEIQLAQIIQDKNSRYAVYEIHRQRRRDEYKLINVDTLEMCVTTSIIPIHEYFGKGFYYTSQYLSFEEMGELLTTAENKNISTTPINNRLQFELINYSLKAIALFGDTKPIKDLLSAMGGKFNPRLTHNNEKKAGWIFSHSKKNELQTVLNLNK